MKHEELCSKSKQYYDAGRISKFYPHLKEYNFIIKIVILAQVKSATFQSFTVLRYAYFY